MLEERVGRWPQQWLEQRAIRFFSPLLLAALVSTLACAAPSDKPASDTADQQPAPTAEQQPAPAGE